MQPGFKFSTPKPADAQAQQQASAPAFSPGATAKQPDIPSYAKGVDPFGNPYFGEGVAAIGKKWLYNFTKDVKPVEQTEWDDLKARWKNNLAQSKALGPEMPGQTSPEQAKLNQEALGLAVESVSKLWQAGTSKDGSLLSGALKFTSATVQTIGDVFSIPAQWTEQAIGATQGFHEAANEVDNPLLPRLDENSITKALQTFTPLGVAYDFARLALSPTSNKWDTASKKIEEGWQSGRILYSQIFDHTIKEQFLREYRAGGDPALIAMKLANPLAEIGGQLLLDPLNVAGVVLKSEKIAKQIAETERLTTSGGLLKLAEGEKAFKTLANAQDDITAAKAVDELVTAQREAVAAVKGESKILKVAYGVNDLTTNSRREGYVQRSKDFLGVLSNTLRSQGMNNDGIVEAIWYGVKSVSNNADEMKAGLSAISHMPNANMWLSDQAIETFTVMKNLMQNEDGIVDGGKLLKLMQAKDPAEFAEEAVKLLNRASHAQFPDVSELEAAAKLAKQSVKEGGTISQKTAQMAKQFDELPNHVKYLNKINNTLTKYIKNPINSILSPLYFNLQGGVAVKNIVTNDELILIDQGAKAWFKDGKYWSQGAVETYLKDIFGEVPTSAHGFESLVNATGAKPWGFGKLMEKGESAAAMRVVGASVKDSMGKMLKRGKALYDPAREIKAGIVSAEQAADLDRLVHANNGNLTKAIEEFRNTWAAGYKESWRNLDFMTDLERKALDSAGYLDEIRDLARTGAASKEDVIKTIDKIRTSIASRAELAVNDVVGLNADHLGAESWGNLMKAVEEGLIDPNDEKVFTAIMESAEQARVEYRYKLSEVADKAREALSRDMRFAEAEDIAKQMREITHKIDMGGPATARKTKQLTEDAWIATQEARKVRSMKPAERIAEYKKLWGKFGLEGVPPVDLDESKLLGEVWRVTREEVAGEWGGMLDTVFGESETVLKQIGEIVDAEEIDAMAARARQITEQSHLLRKARYDGKHLRITMNESPYDIAKKYGISSASKDGKPQDAKLLAIINKYTDMPADEVSKAAEAAKATGIPGEQQILQQVNIDSEIGGNPIALLQKNGGVNAKEFSDVMGIDEAGRTLWEYGFMSKEDASDVNKVRDFIRSWDSSKRSTTFTELFNPADVQYSDAGKLINTPKDWKFTSLDEVPSDVVKRAFDNQRKAHGLEPLNLPDQSMRIPPPHPDGTRPSLARAWSENSKGLNYVLDRTQNSILERWGQMTKGTASADPRIEEFIKNYTQYSGSKIAEAKAVAMRVADEQRKFTLLNYGERTYGDVALSYIMPYHFFYTRSYNNWMKRVATSPEIVAGYGKYKNALEDINKDLPDWYKQQLDVTGLLGIQSDHPLFLNLEATFNPLYGLTGTDFNDAEKRTNWVTATFDDMGKFGPTLWAPIQMGIASVLYNQGQTDAASRWGNRIIPETATIKAVSSFFGKPIELDPAVNFFSDGIDPYERGRMGYAAAQLIADKRYTAEEVQAQFAAQEGPAWDEAYQIAVNNRAPSQISSFFLGVGFKPRSKNDVMVEEMYTKLNQLYAMSDTMDQNTYRGKWEELRASYPPGLVDSVLLAKKGGAKRDAAYAYNVLGRLPPGQMNDVFTSLGISQEDISRFYDSKGFTNPNVSFTTTEKQRFMAAIVDMGAMLKIPSDTTQREWSDARTQYTDIQDQVKKQLGDDIWEKVSHYYDLKDDNRQAADDFQKLHPEVIQALKLKQQLIVENPLVDSYFGGIDTIESYVNGQVRQQLTDKYGPDIYEKQTAYYNMKLADPKGAKRYLAQHPELKKYWAEKSDMENTSNALFLQLGQQLPTKRGAEVIDGYTPQSGVQKNILDQIQTPTVPSWDQLTQITGPDMSPALQTILQNYWATGEPLQSAANSQLDYLAKKYGDQLGTSSGDDFLRMAGLSLTQAPAAPQEQAQQPTGFQFGQ